MCKKVFIAATGQHCGKTTTSLSLMHCAKKRYDRVGFIKPIGPKVTQYQGKYMDVDAALMCQVYDLHDDIEQISPVVLHRGTTQRVLDGDISPSLLEEQIIEAVHTLEKKCDFLIIEGAGHSGVGSVIGMSNAKVARLTDAPVMMISGGGVGQVIDEVNMNLALYQKEGVDVRLILANKLIAEKREKTMRYMKLAFKNEPFEVLGGMNYSPILADPTLSHISKFLNLDIMGDIADKDRIIHRIMLGGASSQRVVDMLKENTLIVVNTSRDELLVTLASLYEMPEYREKIVGLVISGILPVSSVTQQIITNSQIPYIRTQDPLRKVFMELMENVSKITIDDKVKIDLIRNTVEQSQIFKKIDPLF